MTNAPYPDDASLKRLRKEVVDENAQQGGEAKTSQNKKTEASSSGDSKPKPASSDKAKQ